MATLRPHHMLDELDERTATFEQSQVLHLDHHHQMHQLLPARRRVRQVDARTKCIQNALAKRLAELLLKALIDCRRQVQQFVNVVLVGECRVGQVLDNLVNVRRNLQLVHLCDERLHILAVLVELFRFLQKALNFFDLCLEIFAVLFGGLFVLGSVGTPQLETMLPHVLLSFEIFLGGILTLFQLVLFALNFGELGTQSLLLFLLNLFRFSLCFQPQSQILSLLSRSL
mmetsp:Transcript_56000/g.93293  ORF Transcript_56000/g.93293 Transcript_56000/m.93293 type:complete len:228 (-) Transcript_56000:131-814(-)